MKWLDNWFEASARRSARNASRRGFLTKLGAVAVGASAVPLLPVARADDHGSKAPAPADPGDPATCEYWRHCAIDGFLCSCCGGSQNTCPPGTEMSPITWVGTCRNPSDNKDYIISYNDCCGKSSCARCMCNRNEGDKPIYYPSKSNDINWCLGTTTNVYNCSTAIVLGLAVDS